MKNYEKDLLPSGEETPHKSKLIKHKTELKGLNTDLDYFDKTSFETHIIERLEGGMDYKIGSKTYDLNTFVNSFLPECEKKKKIIHHFNDIVNYFQLMRMCLSDLKEHMLKAVLILQRTTTTAVYKYEEAIEHIEQVLFENDKLKETVSRLDKELAVEKEKLRSRELTQTTVSPQEGKESSVLDRIEEIKDGWKEQLRAMMRERREQKAQGKLINKKGKALKIFPKQLCNSLRMTLEYQQLEREGVNVKDLVSISYGEVAKEYYNLGELQEEDYDQ